jgi:hypothetical protein
MNESRLLYEDPYCTVRLEPKLQLVTYVRNATPFPDIKAARRMYITLASLDPSAAPLVSSRTCVSRPATTRPSTSL